MASSPIISGKQKWKRWKQWQILFSQAPKSLWTPKVTAAVKLKDFRLLLGRKAMTNLDSILKSGDIILPTKVHIVKAMLFPVVMHGCENWVIKKAKCWRIDAFKLCWRRLLKVPETAERSNQSILKEVNPEIHWKYCGEALILWPPDMKSRLTGKDPDAGKDCRQKEKGAAEREMVGWPHRLNGHEFEQTLGDSEGQRSLVGCNPWGCKVRHDLGTKQQ